MALSEHQTAPVSAIVTAFDRPEMIASTLRRLHDCRPAPSEIIVHVDGNRNELAEQLRASFPGITILASTERLGPGGARNRLLHAASAELVASFDDDSYPADADFFARVVDAAETCPDAAVIMTTLLDGSNSSRQAGTPSRRVATFVGAGCIYRRSIFLQTTGYVPLPLAYGMEEVDLSLRLHAMGRCVVHVPGLRVVHEVGPLQKMQRIVFHGWWPHMEPAHDPGHRDTPEITRATVANLALLPFLRYPVLLWPYGLAQCLHKVLELAVNGRGREALAGLCRIPSHLWRHRSERSPLRVSDVWSFLQLRREEMKSAWVEGEK